MSKQTIYHVIDAGIDHLLEGYERWGVSSVLDQTDTLFPNHIHWQYGHLLTVFEFTLSMCEQNEVDIGRYNALFGYGTRPDEWGEAEIPSIEEIFEHLRTLPERARNLTGTQLDMALEEPIVGCETVGELLVLNAVHVPLHNGKIEEMTRVLKQR